MALSEEGGCYIFSVYANKGRLIRSQWVLFVQSGVPSVVRLKSLMPLSQGYERPSLFIESVSANQMCKRKSLGELPYKAMIFFYTSLPVAIPSAIKSVNNAYSVCSKI